MGAYLSNFSNLSFKDIYMNGTLHSGNVAYFESPERINRPIATLSLLQLYENLELDIRVVRAIEL